MHTYIHLIAMQPTKLPYKSCAFLPSAETGSFLFSVPTIGIYIALSTRIIITQPIATSIVFGMAVWLLAGPMYNHCKKDNCCWKNNSQLDTYQEEPPGENVQLARIQLQYKSKCLFILAKLLITLGRFTPAHPKCSAFSYMYTVIHVYHTGSTMQYRQYCIYNLWVAMVNQHHVCTFENLKFHFHFAMK